MGATLIFPAALPTQIKPIVTFPPPPIETHVTCIRETDYKPKTHTVLGIHEKFNVVLKVHYMK